MFRPIPASEWWTSSLSNRLSVLPALAGLARHPRAVRHSTLAIAHGKHQPLDSLLLIFTQGLNILPNAGHLSILWLMK